MKQSVINFVTEKIKNIIPSDNGKVYVSVYDNEMDPQVEVYESYNDMISKWGKDVYDFLSFGPDDTQSQILFAYPQSVFKRNKKKILNADIYDFDKYIIDQYVYDSIEVEVKVDWDTDDDDPDVVGLPETVMICPVEEDMVADYISDNYDYCINSWEVVNVVEY